jgi:ribonuclease HII
VSVSDRLQRPLDVEREFWSRGVRVVAGVDEVGRGPLAGPVVAAAVVLAPGCEVCGAYDSKRLTARQREALAEEILATTAVGMGAASAREVDRLNVRRATALAMQRAIQRLPIAPDHLLVDGLPVPELGLEWQTAVVAGDRRVHSIACASIVAKVCRDRLMGRLAARYPGYGWQSNKGYGTAEHRDALRRLGPTPHHRRSFQPVEQLSLDTEL